MQLNVNRGEAFEVFYIEDRQRRRIANGVYMDWDAARARADQLQAKYGHRGCAYGVQVVAIIGSTRTVYYAD